MLSCHWKPSAPILTSHLHITCTCMFSYRAILPSGLVHLLSRPPRSCVLDFTALISSKGVTSAFLFLIPFPYHSFDLIFFIRFSYQTLPSWYNFWPTSQSISTTMIKLCHENVERGSIISSPLAISCKHKAVHRHRIDESIICNIFRKLPSW